MNSIAGIFVTVVVLVSLVVYIIGVISSSKMKNESSDGTTGHTWDGITELNEPLPKWWFYTFIGLTVWGIVFVFLYPALGNYKGVFGWTAESAYESNKQSIETKYNEYFAAMTQGTVEEMSENTDVINSGRRLFGNYCALCHGSDAGGAQGYPNLADTDWLYGGTGEAIIASITNGRAGLMPAQDTIVKGIAAANNIDENTAVDAVVDYTLSLSEDYNSDLLADGKVIFENVCFACHATDGTGNQMLGGPNLTDHIWLYGDVTDQAAIRNNILSAVTEGHHGEMPAHKDLLSEDKIKVLAAYVYSLSKE